MYLDYLSGDPALWFAGINIKFRFVAAAELLGTAEIDKAGINLLAF